MRGNSSAQRSLLLDYTRSQYVRELKLSAQRLTDYSNAVVWMKAVSNRHYVVALSSIVTLLVLSFQPLSAALFGIREVFEALPGSASMIDTLDLPSLSDASSKCPQLRGNISY